MKKEKKEQVELYKLVFTMNWEDPQSDLEALQIKPGETLMTITSGGCNTIGFLLQDPKEVFSVDINPSQSHVLALKIAAMKCFSYEEFIGFSGLVHSKNRKKQFESVKAFLNKDSVDFWEHNLPSIEKGFLFGGRYEKFVILVGKLIRAIQGNFRINGLFEERTAEEQIEFFDQYWDTKRTRFIFNMFFNKKILARRGLKADYFTFDDGATSFAQSFFNKFRNVARLVPIKGNYFLHLYLRGKYKSTEEVPSYLEKRNFQIIKNRLDRIRIVTDDAKKWLAKLPDNSIDCFALSNICELMSLDDTLKMFNEVFRTARPGARISFRNLMIPREVPETLQDKIILDRQISNQIFKNDRAFVYSKVSAYKVLK